MSARHLTLVAHYEWVADQEVPTWWAVSDDLPGFTAAYPSLGELQREAEDAVRFALETDDVEVDWISGGDVPEWAAVHIEVVRPGLVRDGGPSSRTYHLDTQPAYSYVGELGSVSSGAHPRQ